MAMASRGSGLNKTLGHLGAKMRNSCVDCHYTSKYWVRLHPNDAIKPQWADDTTWYSNAVTRPLMRLLLLPIWLPYWFWKRGKTKSEMTEFVVAGTSGRLADDEVVKHLALEWVGLHPGDFIFGQYDPKVAEIQSTFEKILSEST